MLSEEEFKIKIELLTTELERSSQVLQQRGLECEEQKLKQLGLQQILSKEESEKKRLSVQYNEVEQQYQHKLNELDKILSNINYIEQVVLQNYEQKQLKLIQEIEQLNQVIETRIQDKEITRTEIMEKIKELQEERQKTYHLENFVKKFKQEKLEALHQLKLKSEEVDQLNNTINNLKEFQIEASNLRLDLESIRTNYSGLYDQHSQEIDRLRAQVDNQRQANHNIYTILENQFVKQLSQERNINQQMLKDRVQHFILQLGSQVNSLKHLLNEKSNEIERIKSDRISDADPVKNHSILIQRDQMIHQLRERLEYAESQYQEKREQLEHIEEQIQTGYLIPYNAAQIMEKQMKHAEEREIQQGIELKKLEETKQDLVEELTRFTYEKNTYQKSINEYLYEINLQKEEINRMNDGLKKKQKIISQIQEIETKLLLSREEEEISEFKRQRLLEEKNIEIQEADDRIKYILQLIEMKDRQINQYQQNSRQRETIPKVSFIDERGSQIAQSFYKESQYYERS